MARHEYTMIALTLWGNIITNKDFTFGLCFKSIEIIAFPLLLTIITIYSFQLTQPGGFTIVTHVQLVSWSAQQLGSARGPIVDLVMCVAQYSRCPISDLFWNSEPFLGI